MTDQRCTCDDTPRDHCGGVKCLPCFWLALRWLLRGRP